MVGQVTCVKKSQANKLLKTGSTAVIHDIGYGPGRLLCPAF